jgi:hypothetical protein
MELLVMGMDHQLLEMTYLWMRIVVGMKSQ